jgi:hypothetical protein
VEEKKDFVSFNYKLERQLYRFESILQLFWVFYSIDYKMNFRFFSGTNQKSPGSQYSAARDSRMG